MAWYRNSKIIATCIFAILILVTWLMGPAFGLATTVSRLVTIILILLVWVLFLMIGKLVRDRSAGLLERMLRRKADDAVVSASPEKRAETSLLRQRLLAAIETLKSSHLGKTRGQAALYELPWYMVVGHPSAGKSCAIVHSGLKFPLAAKGGSSVQGVGGTRNCDWFFSTEGVLLDTAGRYSTHAEDRSEWLEFLNLLRKYRPKAPLNGILVALSLPELLRSQTEAFTIYARQIRQRINEVDRCFGTRIPVYLVFTKMDLLQGFTQFFEDLGEDETQQVWGATLPHEQAEGFDTLREVAHRFEALFRGITQLGTDKLASSRANQKRPALFAFPLEFHGLQSSISRFVELLVEPDPYHTKPLLRGFYFTSALQENRQSLTTGSRVSSQFDLTRIELRPLEPENSRPFFLEGLFRRVIFPDMFLVGRSINPRKNRWRLAGILVGTGILACLLGFWTWSYAGNRALIGVAREELEAAGRLSRAGSLQDRMKALQVLQFRLEQLYRYRKSGHPLALGGGLYQGSEVEKALRSVYFQGVHELMLEPVRQQLEGKLQAALVPTAPPTIPAATRSGVIPTTVLTPVPPEKRLEDTYLVLKTYLMLHSREHMEETHLADQLPRYWRPWLERQPGAASQADIARMAERTISFYVSQIHEPDLPLIGNQDGLVAQARSYLRGEVALLSPLERLYNEMKAQGNTRFAPVTVASILGNKDLDLVGASRTVPGVFTRQGWSEFMRDAIEQGARGQFKGTDWVLASSLEDERQMQEGAEIRQQKLQAMYQNDYISEWEKFLQGVAVHPYLDPGRAATAMGRFGDAQASPIRLIFAKVAFETAWDNPSELDKTLDQAKKSILQKTNDLLGTGTTPSSAGGTLGPVGGHFRYLAEMVIPQSGGRAPIDAYLDLLIKVRTRLSTIASSGDVESGSRQLVQATLSGSASELGESLQYVDTALLGRVEDPGKTVARPLLVRPLMEAFGACLKPAGEDLNRAWLQQVYTPWSSLANKYPFSDAGNEASMGEIARFLNPKEGCLPRFVDKELGALVVRRGDAFAARTWGSQGMGFHPGFLDSISRLVSSGSSLLQDGETSRFELQPVPTPGLTDILLEVDGQKLLYRMGPQSWIPLTWPGQGGVEGARLQVTSFAGATAQVYSFPGRLGLLRLLDQARVENPHGTPSSLEWHFKVPPSFTSRSAPIDGRDGYYPHNIRFNFRLVGGTNPLDLNALRHHTLPQRIVD